MLAVLSLMATALVSAPLVWQWRCRRDVERQLAELRAAGVPTTPEELDASYQLPHGKMDCTDLWLVAIESLTAGETELRDCGLPYLDPTIQGDAPLPGEEWPQLAEVEALLTRFQPSIDKLHEAASQGGAARWSIQSDISAEDQLLEMPGIKVAARLLQLEARVRAHHGDTQGVLSSIGAQRALARSLDRRPGVVAFLIRVAIHQLSDETLLPLLPSVRFREDELDALQSERRSDEYRRHLTEAARGERVRILSVMERGMTMDDGRAISTMQGPTGWHDKLRLLYFMEQLEEAAGMQSPESLLEFNRIEQEIVDTASSWKRHGCMMTLLLLPSFEPIGIATTRAEAQRDGMIAILAAERSRLNRGDWPNTLDALVPEFMPAVPKDPFDGQSLRYLVDDDGMRIYSVGFNRIDDGGTSTGKLRTGDDVLRLPRK